MDPKSQIRTVGLVQMECTDDAGWNLDEAVRGIQVAANKGAQIVCLQELFRSRYFCQTEDIELFSLAETIPGPSTEKLSALARQLAVVLIVPLFEKRTEGIYHNTVVVIDADGSTAGKYRKMQIPHDPCFYEKYYFTPGDTGFCSFHTRFGRVGVLICWDQWFPEAARLTALSGAQFIFYPTAIGYRSRDFKEAEKQANAWETIQKSHAIANGVFVASVNRVGTEQDIHFWGRSFVCDPFGEVLTSAKGLPQVLTAHCDLSLIESTRRAWPFLRDRRVDFYGDITRIYFDPNDQ